MKKNTVSLLLAASALVFMAGCAGGAKNSAAQKDETVNESQAQTDAVDSEAAGTEEAGLKSQEAFSWLPADVVREKSETEPNEELRKLIAEYYEIPDKQMTEFRAICDPEYSNTIYASREFADERPGKRVRVIHGPFKGMEGKLVRYKDRFYIVITLVNLGVFLRISRWYCEPID